MSSRTYPAAPVPAVGAVVVHEGAVLLVRRGQAPSRGVWAVPGGRVELGETLAEATEREVREETGVSVRAGEPVWSFDSVIRDEEGRVSFHYVIVDLLAEYVAGEPRARDDALEARWVRPEDIPGLLVSRPTLELLERLRFLAPPGTRTPPLTPVLAGRARRSPGHAGANPSHRRQVRGALVPLVGLAERDPTVAAPEARAAQAVGSRSANPTGRLRRRDRRLGAGISAPPSPPTRYGLGSVERGPVPGPIRALPRRGPHVAVVASRLARGVRSGPAAATPTKDGESAS